MAADLSTVRAAILAALDEADAALGNTPTSQVVVALQTQAAKAQVDLATANTAIGAVTQRAVAAETLAASLQSKVNAAKAALA